MEVQDDSNDILSRFEKGIEKFNKREFFDCHDIIEDIWFEIRGKTRTFYQGLIHLAVGFYHITIRENPKGAISQLTKGIEKLNDYSPQYNGVEIQKLLHKVSSCIKEIKKMDIGKENFPIEKIPKIFFKPEKFKL